MIDHSNTDHTGNFMLILKGIFAWILVVVSTMTAEKFATYLAITYSILAIIVLVRREFFPKKRKTKPKDAGDSE